MLTMKEVSISKFMSDFYFSALEKFAYHIYNVKLLFKKILQSKRKTVIICKPGSVLTFRDYSERFSAHFALANSIRSFWRWKITIN